jgi:hypothetical protein
MCRASDDDDDESMMVMMIAYLIHRLNLEAKRKSVTEKRVSEQ